MSRAPQRDCGNRHERSRPRGKERFLKWRHYALKKGTEKLLHTEWVHTPTTYPPDYTLILKQSSHLMRL